MNWKNFEEKFKNHPVYKSEGGVGTVIRNGSLFGGSYDGPTFLREDDLALEEGMYKVSGRGSCGSKLMYISSIESYGMKHSYQHCYVAPATSIRIKRCR